MTNSRPSLPSGFDDEGRAAVENIDMVVPLLQRWRILLVLPLLAAMLALGITYLVPMTFTSRTVLLSPQQQGSAAAALAQLGALTSLAGAAAGVRAPGEQYVAILQSQTVADRIIDAFDLMRLYEAEYRFEARKRLAENSRISLGRKDGLITIEVDDTVPQRAADIANHYVDELRRRTNEIALTEAQQRRAFLEQQVKLTRDRLAQAQEALQTSGYNPGALKADARAAAESYARVRAEVAAAEIRLQALRLRLADSTPEVQAVVASLQALRAQLARLESSSAGTDGGSDYIAKFREFKYQETLFDLFARQYEMARVDEAKEGTLIQVIDLAKPAERRSKPKRAMVVATTWLAALVATALVVIALAFARQWLLAAPNAARLEQLKRALGRG